MIPIAMPLLGEEEADAARAAVLSGWVSQGPTVAAFEKDFTALTGAAYACAVSNCTTALHLALMGVGVGPGDEVITVSHSFIAGANAIRQCGGIPVFVDIEEGGYNIDPALIEAAITPATRAILVVHQIGMPCDMVAILRIARAHGLRVVEDAACAIGSDIRLEGEWQPIGRPIGDVTCFSFHPRKVITTGEGGMLTTDDPEIDARFRLWRQHGMSVSDTQRHASRDVVFEGYPVPGYNYRMTDIQAAVGRQQLLRLPGIVAARRALAEAYAERLADMDGVLLPWEPVWARSNWQSFAVRLDPALDQRAVMQHMLEQGVATRRGIMCMHLEPACADIPLRHPLPRSESARDQTVLLPLFAQMTTDQMEAVVAALAGAVAAGMPGALRAIA
ncbi:DegT/DnrJ/EryC1/StrS family aminotransferase [Falsirhodobacter algicola]|uniref:Aminotransferase class V-fold PLP-dependent enzyme n=1 Tax=Falsirhodobacter algicola TaxID=2692330 RepID=A0A8J8MRG3_9RHOB|nr:DegT/DnrJ/EryC1/StrS family aminotransferase [Falsirhodobacter algicola]QUS35107.1 aminotransferase class V-fold PLP-dependent enzyme [Falsirhodobacter algicola]